MIKSREGRQRKMKTSQTWDRENGSENKLRVRIAVGVKAASERGKRNFEEIF